MRIILLTNCLTSETNELLKQVTSKNVSILTKEELLQNDNIQKNFELVYAPNPNDLLNLRIRIPYFYDIPIRDINYNIFSSYYSQISGAKAVFVKDKKLNKFAEWSELNTYWVNSGIDLIQYKYWAHKYLTPQLHILYIDDNPEVSKIIQELWYARKANWILHIYKNKIFKPTENIILHDDETSLKQLYDSCHIFLNPDLCSNNFPSSNCLEAMSSGCTVVSSNDHGNLSHILFDKVHYFKLDFIDKNTILETIRYVDKRREKLDRLSLAGSSLVHKYFDLKQIVRQKIEIFSKYI